jgi:hypothetical protein
MVPGQCCPGRVATRRISVGGQEVGISGYEEIIGKALSAEGATDEELKQLLLKELKIHNYVPGPVEGEYLEGIWREFVKERSKRGV